MHQKLRRFFIDFEGQIGGQNGAILDHVGVKLDPRKKTANQFAPGTHFGPFWAPF